MLRGREQISTILQQSPACVLSSHFTCMGSSASRGAQRPRTGHSWAAVGCIGCLWGNGRLRFFLFNWKTRTCFLLLLLNFQIIRFRIFLVVKRLHSKVQLRCHPCLSRHVFLSFPLGHFCNSSASGTSSTFPLFRFCPILSLTLIIH